MDQQTQQTTQQIAQALPETTKEVVVTAEIKALAQAYFDKNRLANDAKKEADKARKELHAAMIESKLTNVEVSGGFIDRYAKDSADIDPLLVKDYLTPEQFWASSSVTKAAVKKYLPDAIIDKCTKIKVSKEDVHIRKK